MSLMFKIASATHVALYRASGGRIGGAMGHNRVVLLTTTGSKTGKARTVPVMLFEDGERRFVVASAGGSAQHPAWFKNLQKTPTATVELPGERYAARPEVLQGEERARIWKLVIERAPRFAAYEEKAAGREIPVVELKRA